MQVEVWGVSASVRWLTQWKIIPTLLRKSCRYVKMCPFCCPIPSESAWMVAALWGGPWEVLHSSLRGTWALQAQHCLESQGYDLRSLSCLNQYSIWLDLIGLCSTACLLSFRLCVIFSDGLEKSGHREFWIEILELTKTCFSPNSYCFTEYWIAYSFKKSLVGELHT